MSEEDTFDIRCRKEREMGYSANLPCGLRAMSLGGVWYAPDSDQNIFGFLAIDPYAKIRW